MSIVGKRLENQMTSKEQIIWEGGINDAHCWLENGLHVRITTINLPSGPSIFIWDVSDPLIRAPVAASVYEFQLADHPKTLELAKSQALYAASKIKPYGS